jgi:hypothetical protein
MRRPVIDVMYVCSDQSGRSYVDAVDAEELNDAALGFEVYSSL